MYPPVPRKTAVLSQQVTEDLLGVHITCVTDLPAQCWVEIAYSTWRSSKTGKRARGFLMMCETAYYFPVLYDLDDETPGLTAHSFHDATWLLCRTQWYRFK